MKNDCLRTPEYIHKALGPFDMDPCAGENTDIGEVNYALERGEDGLSLEWKGLVYCNPPFSKKEEWIAKMLEHRNGILVLPERGSAPWFGLLAMSAGCYFVMGKKINFEGGSSSNNVGSVLFTFGYKAVVRVRDSKLPGHFVDVKYFRPRTS